MFELLLQADKALADGSLDQAERTYWQLIELDSQNAIAVAGLARVALERGDEKKARQFADQALGIDPDSIAARRIIETLSHTGTRVVDDPIAQQMLGAERLEALSHRRVADAGADDKTPSQGKGPRRPGVGAEARDDDAGTVRPGQAAGDPEVAASAGSGATLAAGSAAPGGSSGGRESRGRTRPDQMEPMPTEPLRERRKAGRLAAAAAAAAAAAREPVKARHQPHHAMPIGRRFFEVAELKPPAVDEFSEAEMAAAIEAVDAVDEPVLTPAVHRGKAPALGRGLGQAELLGAVEATDPDESVALRLAMVAEALDLDAAEKEATQVQDETIDLDEEANDSFEAAEAVASSSLHAAKPSVRGTQPTYLIDPDDDFDAAEAEAKAAVGRPRVERQAVPAPAEPKATNRPEVAAGHGDALATLADAAEAAAATEAMKEISRADVAAEPEAVPARRPFKVEVEVEVGEEPSEAEAEAQALREALALVLDAEPPGGPEDGPGSEREGTVKAGKPKTADATATPEPAEPTERAEQATNAEPGTQSEPEAGPAAATPEPAEAPIEPRPRRGGIFRRIRGG